MKDYFRKFKLSWNGIEWGQSSITFGTNRYFYYFKWGFMSKEMRDSFSNDGIESWMEKVFGWPNFGLYRYWYDCPHAQLNLYYFCFYWSTYWTKPPKSFLKKDNKNE
jgi:hypothetical protein